MADPQRTWVPVTVVGAILITAISGTMYAAEVSGQAKQNASDNARQESRIEASIDRQNAMERQLIEQGVLLRSISETLSEMKHDIKSLKHGE